MATEYLTTDIDLKKVADGIRSRTGKTTPLAFPDGYVTEIGTLTNTSDATAKASEILKDKTAYVAGSKLAGTMPNNGAAAIQLSDLTAKPVTAGYYSGGTAKVADAEAAKIIPENIKKGVTILGVEGTMEASAGGDYNIAATTNADGTQNLAITDAAGGGGGSSFGYKVTFPATATNWNRVYGDYSGLLMADGTVKPITDYSTLAGQTFEGVVGIKCRGANTSLVLKMTLSSGTVAQTNVAVQMGAASFNITASPNTTPTFFGAGQYTFWWPLTDVVISAIEMYNTD